jgi:hypothetical protein
MARLPHAKPTLQRGFDPALIPITTVAWVVLSQTNIGKLFSSFPERAVETGFMVTHGI